MQNSLFGKRGVSAVVVTVLIIMITVAAVGIVWAVVIPMIRDNLGVSTCEDVDISISTTQGFTCYDSTKKVVAVQIKKGSNEVNVTGVEFILSSGGNSYSEKTKYYFSQNNYHIFYINTSDLSSVEKVSVVPVASGKKNCGVVSVENLPNCNLELENIMVINIKEGNSLLELGDSCFSNSECSSDYCNTLNNICSNGLTGIDSCAVETDCVSGVCGLNQICGGISGDVCVDNLECQSGKCVNDSQSYKCTDGAENSPCSVHSDCNGGYYCTNPGNNVRTCSPFLVANYGPWCFADDECYSGWCNGNTCMRGDVGDPCWWDNSYCRISGYCGWDPTNMYGGSICTNGITGIDRCAAPGNPLSAARQCVSGYCNDAAGICSSGEYESGCFAGTSIDQQCRSGYCSAIVDNNEPANSNGICTNGIAGDPCADDQNCISNSCISGNCS